MQVNHKGAYFSLPTGEHDRVDVVHKFGRAVVDTTYKHIAFGGAWQMPQVGSATTLRVKAGNANDTLAGPGARKVLIQGINTSGLIVSEELETNGISAGTASSNSYIRLFRAYVSESGTYSDGDTSQSHAADIVIENSAGTADWCTIDSTDVSRGQSEIAMYTVPKGKVAYITHTLINVDSAKAASVLLFVRGGVLDTSAPYEAARINFEIDGVSGHHEHKIKTPLGPYSELTDIGWMGKMSVGTGEIDINFEIITFSD